jgi:hypothetical protein
LSFVPPCGESFALCLTQDASCRVHHQWIINVSSWTSKAAKSKLAMDL